MTEKVHTRCNGQIRYVCTSRSLIGFVEYFYRFFFFLAARAISFAKKNMYIPYFHSLGKYFKSTSIATFLFHQLSGIYVLNSMKKNYCNFFHMHIRQNEGKN